MSINETLQLLQALPAEGEASACSPEIIIDGFIIRGEDGTVRIVTGHLCLDFAVDDVTGIEEQALPEDVGTGLAIPVRLRLVSGARLLNASPADIYEPLLYKVRQPFAIAVRKTPPDMADAPRYRDLEMAFKRQHGFE
jgi:hypothetical protein